MTEASIENMVQNVTDEEQWNFIKLLNKTAASIP